MFSTVSFQYYGLSLFWAPGLKPASLNNSSIMAIWSRKLGFIMNRPVCLDEHRVGTALAPRRLMRETIQKNKVSRKQIQGFILMGHNKRPLWQKENIFK